MFMRCNRSWLALTLTPLALPVETRDDAQSSLSRLISFLIIEMSDATKSEKGLFHVRCIDHSKKEEDESKTSSCAVDVAVKGKQRMLFHSSHPSKTE